MVLMTGKNTLIKDTGNAMYERSKVLLKLSEGSGLGGKKKTFWILLLLS